MALDVSGLSYFMPVFGFLFVFVVVYAILAKTKLLGESGFINSLVSFIMAIIFITISPAREYVTAIIPWFAVLVASLFFVLIIIGFSQKKLEDMMKPSLAWVFILLLVIIFIVAAINVFGPVLGPLIPTSFLFSERFLGALLLLVIAAIVSWVLTRAK